MQGGESQFVGQGKEALGLGNAFLFSRLHHFLQCLQGEGVGRLGTEHVLTGNIAVAAATVLAD